MRGYRRPIAEDEICGETYDHDISTQDVEEAPEGPWTCATCEAEIWPEEN